MSRCRPHRWLAAGLAAMALVPGCGGGGGSGPLLRPETFNWVRQPIAFSPPPSGWERQGDNGGGILGVRFILARRRRPVHQRLRRSASSRSATSARPSRGCSRDATRSRSASSCTSCRWRAPRIEDPISDARGRDGARRSTDELDRATPDYLDGSRAFVAADLDAACAPPRPTSDPRSRSCCPTSGCGPSGCRIRSGGGSATSATPTVAGSPAFASDDTLITPERPLLYHEVFWVVNGCAFKATFQGRRRQPRHVPPRGGFDPVPGARRCRGALSVRRSRSSAGVPLASAARRLLAARAADGPGRPPSA